MEQCCDDCIRCGEITDCISTYGDHRVASFIAQPGIVPDGRYTWYLIGIQYCRGARTTDIDPDKCERICNIWNDVFWNILDSSDGDGDTHITLRTDSARSPVGQYVAGDSAGLAHIIGKSCHPARAQKSNVWKVIVTDDGGWIGSGCQAWAGIKNSHIPGSPCFGKTSYNLVSCNWISAIGRRTRGALEEIHRRGGV